MYSTAKVTSKRPTCTGRILELEYRVLEKDHPEALTSMSKLANVLNHWGKYEEPRCTGGRLY
jgi:hypothetical protein